MGWGLNLRIWSWNIKDADFLNRHFQRHLIWSSHTLPLIDAVQNELFRRGFLEEHPADSGCLRCKPAMWYCLGLRDFLYPKIENRCPLVEGFQVISWKKSTWEWMTLECGSVQRFRSWGLSWNTDYSRPWRKTQAAPGFSVGDATVPSPTGVLRWCSAVIVWRPVGVGWRQIFQALSKWVGFLCLPKKCDWRSGHSTLGHYWEVLITLLPAGRGKQMPSMLLVVRCWKSFFTVGIWVS